MISEDTVGTPWGLGVGLGLDHGQKSEDWEHDQVVEDRHLDHHLSHRDFDKIRAVTSRSSTSALHLAAALLSPGRAAHLCGDAVGVRGGERRGPPRHSIRTATAAQARVR